MGYTNLMLRWWLSSNISCAVFSDQEILLRKLPSHHSAHYYRPCCNLIVLCVCARTWKDDLILKGFLSFCLCHEETVKKGKRAPLIWQGWTLVFGFNGMALVASDRWVTAQHIHQHLDGVKSLLCSTPSDHMCSSLIEFKLNMSQQSVQLMEDWTGRPRATQVSQTFIPTQTPMQAQLLLCTRLLWPS